MKAHLAWLRKAVAAIGATVIAASPAAAQLTPATANQTAAGDGTSAAEQAYPSTQLPAYTPSQPAGAPYQPQVPGGVATTAYPTTARYPANPAYPAVAAQPKPPALIENDVLPQPANGEPPYFNSTNGPATSYDYHGYPGGPASGYPGGPASGYPGYPGTGTYHGSYGAYGARPTPDYGLSGYFEQPCHKTQWFGGVYWLFMQRDNPSFRRLTVSADTGAIPDPYYPPAERTILSTRDIDFDYRSGVEARFGSTFTTGGDPCGGCPPNLWAWEVAWWGLDDDRQSARVIDWNPNDAMRFYGMVNYAGLQYDSGGGNRPVNDYYDYQMPIVDDGPIADGDVRVIAQRVRARFRAQNLELNFLRLPMCHLVGGGCDPCGPVCAPAFTLTGLCGVRYFRVDDDLEFATMWGTHDGVAGEIPQFYDGFTYANSNELFHDIRVKNDLVGFQLGATMSYCVGARWNVFWDTNFGLYNNHIKHYQRVYSGGGGPVTFTETGDAATIRSTKDDVAFLGEMRLGGSYDLTGNCRATLAYRAVAIAGVALSHQQLRHEYSNYPEVASIDSDGSIIIHGVQAGVEWKY